MIINITELGAKPDGITFCEGAIQKAIDMCHEKGGGRVVVPAGVYLSRPIELKSNVTLYLEEGAILKASPYIEDYFKIGYYHNEWGDVTSFLFAMNQKISQSKARAQLTSLETALWTFHRRLTFLMNFKISHLSSLKKQSANQSIDQTNLYFSTTVKT